MSTPDKPAPLTVDQAIERLTAISQRGGGDKLFVIPYNPGRVTMGPSPAMPITGMSSGIDWNRKKVFLHPEQELGIAGDELKQLSTRCDDALHRLYAIKRALAESQSPEAILAAVKKLLPS